MASNSTIMPVLSPSQRGPAPHHGKSEPGSLMRSLLWSGNRTGCESSCSTAISESDSSDVSCATDNGEEVPFVQCPVSPTARFFCPADVDSLLTALSEEQKVHLDRSSFHRECERIFRIMDKDESGFLDPSELEQVIAHLIPQPHKPISTENGKRLMLSIQSVLSSFDKDSDRQLSNDEFPDFVGFCYAWRIHQERMLKAEATSDTAMPASRGRPVASDAVRPASMPCGGAAHRLVRSASTGRSGFLPPTLPVPSSSKTMARSASNPAICNGTSSKFMGSQRFSSPDSSRASSRLGSPEPSRSSKTKSRSASNSTVRSAGSSRRPSKSVVSQSSSSSRVQSPEPVPGSKPPQREDLGSRQMRALKSLMSELVVSNTTLQDLVKALMHNIMAPNSTQAFTKETIDHVCEMALQASQDETIATSSSLAAFMQDLGHFPDEGRNSKVVDSIADEDPQLVMDRAVEVVVVLSLRWLAMKNEMEVPEMSGYAKKSWLPPAFSYLAGQILWRHRTAVSLQSGHSSVVENLRWITQVPEVRENLIDQCNVVFKILSGSRSGYLRLSQWRKVIDLIATNPELRPRVRRCDAVRACYGEALGHSEDGLSRKNFKLMVMKTADLMGVHPVVLFNELASHAEDLEASQKAQKDIAPSVQ